MTQPLPNQITPSETPAASEPSFADPEMRFIVTLGRALHQAGTPADRLEESVSSVALQLGLDAQLFSTPTSLFLSLAWPHQDPRTLMVRTQPSDVDLGRLEAVDTIADNVAEGATSPANGLEQLNALDHAAPVRPRWIEVASWSLASSTAVVFLGGGHWDLLAAAAIGLLVGAIFVTTSRAARWARLVDFLCGAVAGLAAAGLAALDAPIRPTTVTLSALIPLVPGLTLTLALSELVGRHLVSGTARLLHAVIILLSIAFGVALATRIIGDTTAPAEAAQLPRWTIIPALLAAPLAFCVMFRAPFARYWIMLLCGGGAITGSLIGAGLLGPELGSVLGAFITAGLANLYARRTKKPASVGLVPGVLLLVPGSVGLRGFASLAQDNVVSGIDTAFSALLIAASIVAGLILANATIPARRVL